MFELTGELSFIVPIMLAVLVSKWTSDAFVKGGMYPKNSSFCFRSLTCRYEAQIALNQLPFLDNKSEYRFTTLARDVMSRAICYLEIDGHTVGSLSIPFHLLADENSEEFIHSNKYTGYPIVTNRDELQIVGFISREELRSGLGMNF